MCLSPDRITKIEYNPMILETTGRVSIPRQPQVLSINMKSLKVVKTATMESKSSATRPSKTSKLRPLNLKTPMKRKLANNRLSDLNVGPKCKPQKDRKSLMAPLIPQSKIRLSSIKNTPINHKLRNKVPLAKTLINSSHSPLLKRSPTPTMS